VKIMKIVNAEVAGRGKNGRRERQSTATTKRE